MNSKQRQFKAFGKRVFWSLFAGFLIGGPLGLASAADNPSASAQSTAREWVVSHLEGDAAALPFSFVYGGKPSAEIVSGFQKTISREEVDKDRTRITIVLRDPTAQLLIRCVSVVYKDFPAAEWTVYFKNEGTVDTAILSNVRGLDIQLSQSQPAAFELHHQKGSLAQPNDFQPYVKPLAQGDEFALRCEGGRGSNGVMPYFSLHWENQGVLVAIGWPGQWDADFQCDQADVLRVSAGQEDTHFKLLPGEEVRTPLIALQFYDGSVVAGQNQWRRWMVQHNLPRVDGKLPPTQLVACSSHQFGEMINANEENQKQFLDRYVDEKLGLSYWWMDAGWYPNNGSWTNTGTWEVDAKRFPRGLRAVTDHAHAKGLKAIVWFEPERVDAGTWLYENHPEWLLTPPVNPGEQQPGTGWRLLNLGNPAALSWVTDHVSNLLDDEGIDLYRQDFNMDPLAYWRAADAPDRQGITENKYVSGYLAYWDGLVSRHPGLRIDTCSSGGRRLDLETLRRSVPLVRSDYLFEPDGQQCHTYGISNWLPYHGTGTLVGHSAIGQHTTNRVDPYDFRSHMACSVTSCWDMRDETLDYDELRRLTQQMREAAPNFLGDYYPLTDYSTDPDVWMAWQYDRPEEGTGVVLAFRRAQNGDPKQVYRLQGLDPQAAYEVRNVDSDRVAKMSGAELADAGLMIELANPRSAALIAYRKVN